MLVACYLPSRFLVNLGVLSPKPSIAAQTASNQGGTAPRRQARGDSRGRRREATSASAGFAIGGRGWGRTSPTGLEAPRVQTGRPAGICRSSALSLPCPAHSAATGPACAGGLHTLRPASPSRRGLLGPQGPFLQKFHTLRSAREAVMGNPARTAFV